MLAVMLLMGGALAYYKMVYLPGRPHPVWVPLPINPELEREKRDAIIKNLKEKLSDREILVKVSKDLGLRQKLQLDSDDQCASELAARLFVKPGDADTPMGKVPAIHIGVKGTEKESAVSGQIAMRLMDDVWKILGIKPPQKKDS